MKTLTAALVGTALVLITGLITAGFWQGHDDVVVKDWHQKPPPEALTPDLTGERIVFLAVNTDLAAARLLAKWFNQDTGATVEVREVAYDEMLEHVLADREREQPQYDVVEIWYPTIARLVEEEVIQDLTALIDANQHLIQPDDFFSSVYEAYTAYQGRRWALPFDVDTHLLFYRESLLAKHGFEPPRTWGEVEAIARHITREESDSGIVGMASMGYPTAIINVSTYLNRLSAHGGRFLDEEDRPALDSDEALAALEDLRSLQPWVLSSSLEVDYEIARDAFLTGRVAMVEQWTDLGLYAEDPRYSTVMGDWGAVRMPQGASHGARHSANLNAGFSLALMEGAPNAEAAEAFLLYASSPWIQKRLNLSGTGIDVGRHSVIESSAFQQQVPGMAEVLREAYSGDVSAWPVRVETPRMMDQLSVALADVLVGERDPEEALSAVQEQWYRELGSGHNAFPSEGETD